MSCRSSGIPGARGCPVPRDYWTYKAGPALGFASPPSFFTPFSWAWPRPGRCCAAHRSLSALRPLPDTMRKCRCPPSIFMGSSDVSPGGERDHQTTDTTLRSVSWGERDHQKTDTTLCPACRPCTPWTSCCRRWYSALPPPASARSCRTSCRSGMGKAWDSQGLFSTLEGRRCPLLNGGSPPQCHAETTLF